MSIFLYLLLTYILVEKLKTYLVRGTKFEKYNKNTMYKLVFG